MKKLIASFLLISMVIAASAAPCFGASNEQAIFEYLTGNMGMNKAAACGVLANIQRESGFNPAAKCGYSDGSISYGLCQWKGGRFNRLKSYCSSNGYDYASLNGQLHYLQYELEKYEKTAYSKVKSVPDSVEGAFDAGCYWAQYFERCAHYSGGVDNYAKRGAAAVQKYSPGYEWTINTFSSTPRYTVKFDAGEGTPSKKSAMVEKGSAIGNLPSAERPYYTFTGWFAEAECKTPVTAETKVSADMTVYAGWAVAAPEPIAELDTPTGMVIISWDAMEDVDHYEVYRSSSDSEIYVLITDDVKDTSYLDTSANEPGVEYSYKIKGCRSGELPDSRISDSVSRKADYAAPKTVMYNEACGYFELMNKSASDAMSYDVWAVAAGKGKVRISGSAKDKKIVKVCRAVDGKSYYCDIAAKASKSIADSLYSSISTGLELDLSNAAE